MSERLYKYGLVAIFVIGVLLRCVLFIQNASLWGDEAALAFNVCNKSYRELFGGLDILQASPVGFTLMVKFLLNSINPQSDYARDFILRVIPFISGILVIPIFYYLLELIFKDNKKAKLISLFFFVINPCAVAYSAQFKQYSTELLCSVLILIGFYKLLTTDKYKWQYSVLFAVVPWFSYSSFFVLAAGFCCLLIKNWRLCIKTALPVFFSCIIYYFLSLKSVFAVNLSNMIDCWSGCYGFMDFRHPLRFLFKFGELFAVGKLFSALTGFVFFAVCIKYCFYRDNSLKKLLFLLPLGLTILASLMHKYAIQGRLVLFLLPTFAIMIALMSDRLTNSLKWTMAVFMCISLLNYTPTEISYSYSRQIVNYLKENIKSDDIIVLDHGKRFNEYDIYLDAYIPNERIYLNTNICGKKYINACRDRLIALPSGNYYFLSSSYFVEEITKGFATQSLDLGFKPKKIKAIYFTKESRL